MNLSNWMHPDREIWQAGLRTAAAGGLTLLIADFLALPQGYWAVISAVIIVQNRIGASLQAAASRVIGTLVGGLVGFAVAMVMPATPVGAFLGLALALGVLGMMAVRHVNLRVAPLTAAILLVSAPSHVAVTISATHRMIEILVGCAIGVLVSMTVAPGRSDSWMRTEAAEILSRLATLFGIDRSGTDEARDGRIGEADAAIDKAFRSFDTLTKEVAEERASHISRGVVDPERLRHGLRDLRTSSSFMFRMSRLPKPASVADALGGPLAEVTAAVRMALTGLGQSLIARAAPSGMDALDRSFAAFQDTAQNLMGGDSAMDASAVAYLNNLSFALEQVRHSIANVAGCVSDMADAAAGP
ncbi:FUSC family protein [Kaistia sp. MMO-174]|uniref:FUSC family protein n=1 Tax=Kaistia sp. MMO-174 TaxID=3081256 RepID=UPI003018D14E